MSALQTAEVVFRLAFDMTRDISGENGCSSAGEDEKEDI